MMTKDEALKLKGEAHFQIEIWQARLAEANKVLVNIYNQELEMSLVNTVNKSEQKG